MTELSGSASSSSDDVQLAEINEEITSKLQTGEPVHFEEYVGRYPHLLPRLKKLFPTIEALRRISKNSSDTQEQSGQSPVILKDGFILGDFKIIRLVAHGGMGIVYQAKQISCNRIVALKILPHATALNSLQLQRFQNEALAVARLKHKNIVPVYAVGVEQGIHYYAMQFIDGKTLAEMIHDMREGKPYWPDYSSQIDNLSNETSENRESLPDSSVGSTNVDRLEYVRNVVHLVMVTSRALHYAHEQGVVHRDIKPANILIDSNSMVWIADFGLARSVGQTDLTHTGDLIGTVRYMSPEQALGDRGAVDHRTDIYSLGATLYELIVLKPLYQGDDRAELLRKIYEQDHLLPRKIDRRIPVSLETILLKSISEDPLDRYTTAGQFADDLQRFLENRPILATRPSYIERLIKWTRRNRAASAALFAVLLSIGVVLVVLARSNAKLNNLNSELVESGKQLQQSVDLANRAKTHAEEFQKTNRELLYAADIRLASRALQEYDSREAIERLQRHIPQPGEKDVRGMEWRLLNSLPSLNHREKSVHSGDCYYIKSSPDGSTLATGGEDGKVVLLDAEKYNPLHAFKTEQGEVNGIDFSSNGEILASAGDDGSVCLWNLATGNLQSSFFAHESPVYNVLFINQNNALVTCGDDQVIRLWDADTGTPLGVLEGHTDVVEAIAVHPGGKYLASVSGDETIRLWDVTNHSSLSVVPQAHQNKITCLDFSPDGEWLVTGSIDRAVHLWEVAKLSKSNPTDGIQPSTRLKHLDEVQSVAFSPDGSELSVGTRMGSCHLWKLQETLQSPDHEPTSNYTEITIGARELRTSWQAHTGRIYALRFSSDGRYLLTAGSQGTLKIWDSSGTGNYVKLSDQPKQFYSIAPLPQGNHFLTAEIDNVRIRDRQTGKIVQSIAAGKHKWLEAIASPAGDRIIAVNNQGLLSTWSYPAGKLIHQHDLGAPDCHLSFLPNGRHVAITLSNQDQLILLDSTNGAVVKQCSIPTPRHIRTAPLGETLAIASENNVVLYSIKSFEIRQVLQGHQGTVSAVAYHPDGRLLASSGNDRRVIIWDLKTGEQKHTLHGHRSWVVGATFSRDGKSLFTLEEAGTILVWDMRTGQRLMNFNVPVRKYPSSHNAISLSSDGNGIGILCGWDIHVWNVPPFENSGP
ncbi:MAG: protein kinase [Planctomycetaceae bacterium]